MSNQKYVGGGIWRSKTANRAPMIKREEKTPAKKRYTVLGVEVDEKTAEEYERRSWTINGKKYNLLGINVWATSKEIATAFPEDTKATQKVALEIINELAAVNPEGAATARRHYADIIEIISGERIDRAMRHNSFVEYLKDIENIYKADRSERERIDMALNGAKAEFDAAAKDHGMSESGHLLAKAEFIKAQEKHESDMRALAEKFDASIGRIREAILEHINELYAASPDKIDDKTMQFLNAGFATPAELAALWDKNKSNPTMQRVIGSYASRNIAEYDESDKKGRAILIYLESESKKLAGTRAGEDEMSIFNGACEFAKRAITGRADSAKGFASSWDKTFSEYVDKMQAVDRLA